MIHLMINLCAQANLKGQGKSKISKAAIFKTRLCILSTNRLSSSCLIFIIKNQIQKPSSFSP